MRTAKRWTYIVSAADRFGVPGELDRIIKRIQADALVHAAEMIWPIFWQRDTCVNVVCKLKALANSLVPSVPGVTNADATPTCPTSRSSVRPLRRNVKRNVTPRGRTSRERKAT